MEKHGGTHEETHDTHLDHPGAIENSPLPGEIT